MERRTAVGMLLAGIAAGAAQAAQTGPTITVLEGSSEAMRLAAEDLAKDIAAVTRAAPTVSTGDTGSIVVCHLGQPDARAVAARAGIDISGLAGRWEAGAAGCMPDGRVVVCGSDERGAIFAAYSLSHEVLGVSPVQPWTGLPASHRAWNPAAARSLVWKTPAFRFRGWFLNDEDLLTGWRKASGRRRLVHYYFHLPIAEEVYDRVAESALRLGNNFIIPGSYIDIANEVDQRIVSRLVRRGLLVSQHHTQPLGVSGFWFRNYWRDRGKQYAFSYAENPRQLEEVWLHYAKLWAQFPGIIWQIGLRGLGDRAFWDTDANAPSSDKERGRLVSRAIRKQWEIVRSVSREPNPVGTVTLWNEGSALHAKGLLDFPEGLIVVFADQGNTQEMQADFHAVRREPGRQYGVYYHAAFWGAGPRLAQGVSLEKISRNYEAVVRKGDTALSVLNVGNIREFILQIEAIGRITWKPESFAAKPFLEQWCAREYGKPNAASTARLYQQYFESFVPFAQRRPASSSVPDGSGEPLLLDGVIRGAGKQLLRLLLDRDTFAVSITRQDAARWIGQYGAACQKSAERFGKVCDAIRAELPRLGENGRVLLRDNLLVHAETMRGLSLWFYHLSQGLKLYLDLEVAGAAKEVAKAASALSSLLEFRKQAEWGVWRDWYHGDWRMNLPELNKETQALAKHWQELSTLAQP